MERPSVLRQLPNKELGRSWGKDYILDILPH
jgi:hypothetical protein